MARRQAPRDAPASWKRMLLEQGPDRVPALHRAHACAAARCRARLSMMPLSARRGGDARWPAVPPSVAMMPGYGSFGPSGEAAGSGSLTHRLGSTLRLGFDVVNAALAGGVRMLTASRISAMAMPFQPMIMRAAAVTTAAVMIAAAVIVAIAASPAAIPASEIVADGAKYVARKDIAHPPLVIRA